MSLHPGVQHKAAILDSDEQFIADGDALLLRTNVELLFWPRISKLGRLIEESGRIIKIDEDASYEIEKIVCRDEARPLHYELRIIF